MSDIGRYKLEPGTFMLNCYGEWYLPNVNGTAFQTNDSRTVYANHFGGLLTEEDTLYVIVGTDSGLLVDYVIANLPVAGSRYIFVEFPQVIEALRTHAPERLENLPADKVAVCEPSAYQELYEAFNFETYLFAQRLKVLSSLSALSNRMPPYAHLKTTVWNEVEYLRWKVVGPLNAKPFYLRSIENIAENILPAIGLLGAFTGRTALIAAGGPSLDTLMPWIQENRDKITLIAVSRISRRLLQAGLTPDVIVTIDPHPISFNVSRDMFAFSGKSLLVHSSTANKLLVAQWAGHHLYIGNRLNWPNALDVENISVTGPTVTNSAILVATMWGFSRILLAGVDLCFNAQGYTHASGSQEHDDGPILIDLGYLVETNEGRSAQTNSAYRHAADVISEQVQIAKAKGTDIINLSATATRIENVPFCPPEAIDLTSSANDAAAIFAEHIPDIDPDLRLAHYHSTLKYFQQLRKEVETIAELSGEALDANEKLYNKNGKMGNPKHKRTMDRIEHRFNSDLKVAARLVQAFGMLQFAEILRGDDREWTEVELKSWAQRYYTAFQDGCKEVLPALDDGIKRLEMRLEEENKTPDYHALADYWANEETPGRIHVAKALHTDTFAADRIADTAEFAALETQFEASLHEEPEPSDLEEKRSEYMNDLLATARMLFWERNDVRLQRILDHGPATSNRSDGLNIRRLVQGYIHELHGNPDEAIKQYQEMEPGIGVEDGLVQLSILLLDRTDVENAGGALECLTHISPAYIPQYANFLRLTGRPKEALEEYATYFEFAPKDIHTMRVLADFYEELEAPDAAAMMYHHILEADPENETAQDALQRLNT